MNTDMKKITGMLFVSLSALLFGMEYLLFDTVFQQSDISALSAIFWSLLSSVLVAFPLLMIPSVLRNNLKKSFRKDGKVT
jgi:hypothetical protein